MCGSLIGLESSVCHSERCATDLRSLCLRDDRHEATTQLSAAALPSSGPRQQRRAVRPQLDMVAVCTSQSLPESAARTGEAVMTMIEPLRARWAGHVARRGMRISHRWERDH
jgi:hypothetical protein